MGFRTSWIAVRREAADKLLARASAQPTGRTWEHLDSGLWLREVESDTGSSWTLLIADGSRYYEHLHAELAMQASAGGESLYFRCNDGSMDTELRAFGDGQALWSIARAQDPQSDPPFVFDGPVPAVGTDIQRRLAQNQWADDARGVGVDHHFEITSKLGQRLTGFIHNADRGAGFTELRYMPRDLDESGSRLTWKQGVELASEAPLSEARVESLKRFLGSIESWAQEHGTTVEALRSETQRAFERLVEGLQWQSTAPPTTTNDGRPPIIISLVEGGPCPTFRRVDFAGQAFLYPAHETQPPQGLHFHSARGDYAYRRSRLEALAAPEPPQGAVGRVLCLAGLKKRREQDGLLSAMARASVAAVCSDESIEEHDGEFFRVIKIVEEVRDRAHEESVASLRDRGIEVEVGDEVLLPLPFVRLPVWTILDWLRM